MSAKELIFEEEAREKLKEGIDKLANIVGVTLGPKGRTIGLEASWGAPTVTNDGNSIVKEIELKDQYANMGVAMGKEVAAKIKEHCGDGTTTGLILLRSIVSHGIKYVASGHNPTQLKRGMEKTVQEIVKAIDTLAKEVKTEKDRENIATVSASGDSEVGKLICQAFQKVGKAGVITIEEGKTTDTQIEIVEGMQFDRGYVSSYFCTNREQMLAELSDPYILVTDKKINSIHDLLSILQAVATSARELLIIADDIEGDCLSTLVVNRLRGTLKVCAVKAPGFGDNRKALLEDIAILTGGQVVTEDRGMQLKDASMEVLGRAEKIVVSKDHTTIVGGQGLPQAIKARVKQIEAETVGATSSYDKEKLEQRKAKLSGGVAVIRVGAPTEPEMKQKKQVFEDSFNSTKAALEEGIIPGGGVALLRASRKVKESLKLDKEELMGAEIIYKACEAPFRQIVQNSGLDASVIFEEVLAQKASYGFNALTDQVEDLLEAGVIDPAKVTKNVLRYAASAAGIVLISEALIGNVPEDEEEKA